MPKQARTLTDRQVRALKHTGGPYSILEAVGGVPGLHLQITPKGSKSWIMRITSGGKRRDVGLGSYPDTTLEQAREAAWELRKSVKAWKEQTREVAKGEELKARVEALPVLELPLDPVTIHKKAKAATQRPRSITFEEATKRYIRDHIEQGTEGNKKHKAQWRSTLGTYAFPLLRERYVDDIAVGDVFEVLRPIWVSKNETASRVRQRMEKILSWAKSMDYRSGDNPAALGGSLQHLLPKVSKTKVEAHHPAVAIGDARRWWEHLGRMEGQGALALRLAVLCACRSGEIRGLTWGEVELGPNGPEKIVFPAARMKAKTPHIVPLSPAAVAVLRAAAALRDGEAWPELPSDALVFQAIRGGQLSDMTLSAVMRRMHEAEIEAKRPGYLDTHSRRPAVPHGCRSTFRDWAGQQGYPRDLAEEALAHAVGSAVEAAYARSQRAELRKPMMEAWATFLAGDATQTASDSEGRGEDEGPLSKEEALAPIAQYLPTLARSLTDKAVKQPRDVQEAVANARQKQGAGLRLSAPDALWLAYGNAARDEGLSPWSNAKLGKYALGLLTHFAVEQVAAGAGIAKSHNWDNRREQDAITFVAERFAQEMEGAEAFGARGLKTTEAFNIRRKETAQSLRLASEDLQRLTAGNLTIGDGQVAGEATGQPFATLALPYLARWLGALEQGEDCRPQREKLVAVLIAAGL